MSLINDALKRASQAQKQQSRTAPVPEFKTAPNPTPAPAPAAVRSHEEKPLQPSQRSGGMVVPIVAAVVVCVAGAVIWNLTRSSETRPAAASIAPAASSAMASKPAAPVVTTSVTPVPAVAHVQSPQPVADSRPLSGNVTAAVAPAMPSTPTPATVAPSAIVVSAPTVAQLAPPVVPTPVAAPATPAAPTFPPVKLQGIFYSKSPTAMVNGKTLPVGGKVDGVKIAKIEPLSVTVQWNDETKVLELPQ